MNKIYLRCYSTQCCIVTCNVIVEYTLTVLGHIINMLFATLSASHPCRNLLLPAWQEPKLLEDLTGLTQLHAETHARGMSLQEDSDSTFADPQEAGDSASLPDIDDDWTSL